MFGQHIDPAQLRGAPLGWYFTLFFMIQGFMPLGGSIAIGVNMEEPAVAIAVIALGALLSAGVVGFLVRTALRAKARVRHFEETKRGRRAEAQVLGVEYIGQAGTVKSGGSRRSYVKLRVHVRAWFEDRIPFELNDEACYTTTEQIKLGMRPTVWLSLHPSGQGPFLIDPDSLRPQLPPQWQGPQAPRGPQVHIQPTGGANRPW